MLTWPSWFGKQLLHRDLDFTGDQMKVDVHLYYLMHALTGNSFPWFVSGSLCRTALTIFTSDNVWFQALGENDFLRNALLAVSLLINDWGHVAWDINAISVVIKKKGAHQQYYTAFPLSVSPSFSPPSLCLPRSPTPSLAEPWSREEIIQKALAWSETRKKRRHMKLNSLFLLYCSFIFSPLLHKCIKARRARFQLWFSQH